MDGFEPFVIVLIAARDILSFSSAMNENVWFRLENNPTTRARLCVRFFFSFVAFVSRRRPRRDVSRLGLFEKRAVELRVHLRE